MSSLLLNHNSNDTGIIELVYSSNRGMESEEIADAIIGMKALLKEAGNIHGFKNFDVYVFPIEKGSQKLIFKFIKKNAGYAVITALLTLPSTLNDSFELIEKFGANKAHHQPIDVISAAANTKALELCQSTDALNGLQKVTAPVSKEIKVSVRYKDSDQEVEVTCESKQKFQQPLDESTREMILPDWEDLRQVAIVGEITRINKEYKDIGFKYKNLTLKATPLNKDILVSSFHALLDEDQVYLKGLISRDSYYDKPEIKFQELTTFRNSIEIKETV